MARFVSFIACLSLCACGNVTLDEPIGAGGEGGAANGGASGASGGSPNPPGPSYPFVQWARGFQGKAWLAGIAVGPDGAIYVGGAHTGPLAFGRTRVDAEGDRAFLARLSADGEGEWLRSFPGTNLSLDGVLVDDEGSVYLCGDTEGSVDLGLGELTMESGGVFVGKFASDGTSSWSTMFYDATYGKTNGCALDSEASVVVGLNAVMFDGSPQPIVGKLSTDGALLWTLSTPDLTPCSYVSVAVGPEDETYLSWHGGTLDFGAGPVSSGEPGVMLAFTSEQDLLWTAPTDSGGVISPSMSASEAGVMLTGYSSELFSPRGTLAWQWAPPRNDVAYAGIFDPIEGAWIVGDRNDRPPAGGFLSLISPDGTESERLPLGPSTHMQALARIDERHLLVGGDYAEDTAVGGESLLGQGSFIAVIETGPR